MDVIRMTHVKKQYKNGVTAIHDLNLNIEKGDFVFIIGSTGLINIFIRCRFLVAYFIPLIFALKNKHLNLKYNFEFLMLAIVLFINFYYIYYMMCNGIF